MIPFSVILIYDNKKIVPLVHANLPPSSILAHSHSAIIDSQGLWHFEVLAESPNLVRIEYGLDRWFVGFNTGALSTALATAKDHIKDKTLWKFHVDGATQPWMFVDGSLAPVRRMCEKLIDKHVKLNCPQKRYKIHDRPKPHYHNPFGNGIRFACLQVGSIFPDMLDVYDVPDPRRMMIEVSIGTLPNTAEACWRTLLYDQITKKFTIELSPNMNDLNVCCHQLGNLVWRQARVVINPTLPTIPALG